MTNEQARRLDAAIAKAGLNWWEVQRQVGFDVFNDVVAIEVTIAAIEKMAKEEETEVEVAEVEETEVEVAEVEVTEEATTERKCYTAEDAEKAVAIYTNEQVKIEQKAPRERKMNLALTRELELAIDLYNDEVDEDDYIYWWDVLNEMNDLTDDEEVMRVIMEIEEQTKKVVIRKVVV